MCVYVYVLVCLLGIEGNVYQDHVARTSGLLGHSALSRVSFKGDHVKPDRYVQIYGHLLFIQSVHGGLMHGFSIDFARGFTVMAE